MKRLLVTLLGVGLTVGCSILPGSGPVPNLYTLTGLERFEAPKAPVDWPLAIEEPVPTAGLGTDRIAVHPSPFELRYFAKVRWAERLPRMVQTLLVQSFQDSGLYPAVTRQPIGLHRGFSVRTEIRAFEVEAFAAHQAPMVHVTLAVQLVSLPREEIVATEIFDERAVARSRAMVEIVGAFDQAMDRVLADTLGWVTLASQKG